MADKSCIKRPYTTTDKIYYTRYYLLHTVNMGNCTSTSSTSVIDIRRKSSTITMTEIIKRKSFEDTINTIKRGSQSEDDIKFLEFRLAHALEARVAEIAKLSPKHTLRRQQSVKQIDQTRVYCNSLEKLYDSSNNRVVPMSTLIGMQTLINNAKRKVSTVPQVNKYMV